MTEPTRLGPVSGISVVVIPTYNEAQNIEALVEEILRLGVGLRVLIVDDNSPDGTGELADGLAGRRPEVSVLHRPAKTGLGRAYVDGFRQALAQGADCVLGMDADFSHDPKYLPQFLDAAGRADLVIGSRYLPGAGAVGWPLKRVLLSRFANSYVRLITGLRAADCTSGYRLYRREVLEGIGLDSLISRGYSILVELCCRASWLGFRLAEVPIIFGERAQGRSKMSKRVILESALLPWRLRWRRLFRRVGA